MGATTGIQWAHHTFNPYRGCTKVSAGCKNCYAETLSARNPGVLGVWGPRGSRPIAAESYWSQPLQWNAAAEAAGERRRVFCGSLMDVFEGPESMPDSAWPEVREARRRLWHLIDETPWLDWLLLTKRPQNIMRYAPSLWCQTGFPENVWLGTSVEDQETADERIPHLLWAPARVRFLSCEPLLGAVDLSPWLICERCNGEGTVIEAVAGARRGGYFARRPCPACNGRVWRRDLHWVIAGGESGPKARPMRPRWARLLREQCRDAGVAFFFKQWGEWAPWPEGRPFDPAVPVHQFPAAETSGQRYGPVCRVGKKAAGRLLDGREWNELPQLSDTPAKETP